ncbi:hypothetical protein BDV27DRAFT_124578 [Aspergillus caelatus]|uniref:Hydrophobin n=1 Tax=Aspergillus caelatus TaxID=61420 RepID=A0A5N7AB10_9EURO|nr:uncharacterized protein BDV27DRAFT_124578 [Aspergillus caelatus]KAE8367044.1 hypothetical protein BDV27DRAFT_124578 [Aspergillus caelatus]
MQYHRHLTDPRSAINTACNPIEFVLFFIRHTGPLSASSSFSKNQKPLHLSSASTSKSSSTKMQFRSVIALLAAATAVTAAPCDSCDGGDSGDSGDSGSQCSSNQEMKCCSGLTNGILNLDILPVLCLRKL